MSNTNGITLDTDDNFICRVRISDEGKITSYCVGGYRIVVELGKGYKKFTVTKEKQEAEQSYTITQNPKIQITPVYVCMTDSLDYVITDIEKKARKG